MNRSVTEWFSCRRRYAPAVGLLCLFLLLYWLIGVAAEAVSMASVQRQGWVVPDCFSILLPERSSCSDSLRKLSGHRITARWQQSRHFRSGTHSAALSPQPVRPPVCPTDTDGLTPARNPVFQHFTIHSCPARAGPAFLS